MLGVPGPGFAAARFALYTGRWRRCGDPGGSCPGPLPTVAGAEEPGPGPALPCGPAGLQFDRPFCFGPGSAPASACRWAVPELSPQIDTYRCEFAGYAAWSVHPLAVMFGDSHDQSSPVFSRAPVLTKTRNAGDDGSIIWKMNNVRHWASVPSILAGDTLGFAAKKDAAVWRGATTGEPAEYADGFRGRPRRQRPSLVRRIRGLSHDPRVDARVSLYTGGVPELAGPAVGLDPAAMLSYKLVVVAEGNDVATGLKWALGSTSAVVMPRPTVSSWLAEELLVAWVHYIPVRDDYANLTAAVDWCLAQPRQCEAIGLAGRCFVRPFLDANAETAMLRRVMRTAAAATERRAPCTACAA